MSPSNPDLGYGTASCITIKLPNLNEKAGIEGHVLKKGIAEMNGHGLWVSNDGQAYPRLSQWVQHPQCLHHRLHHPFAENHPSRLRTEVQGRYGLQSNRVRSKQDRLY